MTPIDHNDRVRRFIEKWAMLNNYHFKNDKLVIRKKPGAIYLIYTFFMAVGIYMIQAGGLDTVLFGWPICLVIFFVIIEEEVYPLMVCDFGQMYVAKPGLFNRKKYHADQIRFFKIGAASEKSYSDRGYKSRESYLVQQIWLTTLEGQEVKLFRYPGKESEIKSFISDLTYLIANTFQKRVRKA